MHHRDAPPPSEPIFGPGHSGPDDERIPAYDPSLEPDESAGEPAPRMGMVLHRMEIEEPTPEFGTVQAPRGLSGLLRRAAYRVPEEHSRRWFMLMAADRVDMMELQLGDMLAEPLERAGMLEESRTVRSNPLPVFAGIMLGAWAARRILRNAWGVQS